MAQIQQRLDRLVSLDVYTVEKAAMSKDIADLTKDLEQLASKQQQDVDKINRQRTEDANRVTQTRRWLVASVLIPLLGLILPVIMFLAGGK
jgi:t-SNARE complex subunit (syntaxin)